MLRVLRALDAYKLDCFWDLELSKPWGTIGVIEG